MRRQNGQEVTGVHVPESELAAAPVPWNLEFSPAAAIAIGATWIDTFTNPGRDFVITHIGFTAPSEGFPAGPSRWKMAVEDVGKSRSWQPHPFSTTALTGGNHGTSDAAPFKLSKTWRLAEKGTLRIEIENDGNFPGTPILLFIGYLDSAPAFR